jgi:hypothetical protein
VLHARQSANFNLPPESAHYNRFLELADVALGSKKDKSLFSNGAKAERKILREPSAGHPARD